MTVFPEYKTVSVASLIRSKQAITATTIREIARELAV